MAAIDTVEHYAQMRDGVRRKMMKVYRLSEADIALSDSVGARLEDFIHSTLASTAWTARRDAALGTTATDTDKAHADSVVSKIMREYVNTMQLFAKSYDARGYYDWSPTPDNPDDVLYHKRTSWINFTNIYGNHITNLAQAKLTELTDGDEKSAFGMQTNIIGKTMQWCRGNMRYGNLNPDTAGKSPEESLHIIHDFWRDYAECMIIDHRNHVKRLRKTAESSELITR